MKTHACRQTTTINLRTMTVAAAIFGAGVLLSACSEGEQETSEKVAPVAKPVEPLVHNYQCESGETVAVTYNTTESAKVEYKGTQYNMNIAVSASGSRYVGEGMEWWSKGSGSESEGALLQHLAENKTGEMIEQCTQF